MADTAPESNTPLLYDSHLFMVRVWVHESANGEKEWYGKVQHVPTGNVRYFREWSALLAYLQQTLADSPSSQVQAA